MYVSDLMFVRIFLTCITLIAHLKWFFSRFGKQATILKLYELTKDLITSTRPADHRQITYRFYQKLIQCQYEGLSMTRSHFFRVIEANENLEDVQYQLDLLKTLTDNGKNIKDVDDVIGDFIVKRWLAKVSDSKQIREILIMVQNIIVYNAAYLDPNVVELIITWVVEIALILAYTNMLY